MSNLTTASHLTYQAKINNGSFYTPSQLVDYVWEFITPFLVRNSAILDTSAGKGSFFLNRESKDLFLVATDNDKLVVGYLKENFPYLFVIQKNTLTNLKRADYGVSEKQKLIIIGNPPYNDLTSLKARKIKEMWKYSAKQKEFLTDDLEIYRSHPKPYSFKQWTFLKCTITYPLLIYEVQDLLIKVEIVVKEKQKAVGIQPMLYLCLPLKLMEEFTQLENKLVSSKQKASYLVDKNNFHFIIETMRIFALLSKKHHRDVVNILITILNWEENIN